MARSPTAKSPATKVSCIILAAGTSSRMGTENKLLLPWNEKVVVDTVIESIKSINPFELIVVTSEITADHFAGAVDLKIVDNLKYQTGMTSSIQAGVVASDENTEGYMICLGDQPSLKSASYKQLLNVFSEKVLENQKVILAPFFEGKKGNPVIFSSSYKQEILDHREPEGCKQIIQKSARHLLKLDVEDESVLLDMDTPEKYREIRKRFLDI